MLLRLLELKSRTNSNNDSSHSYMLLPPTTSEGQQMKEAAWNVLLLQYLCVLHTTPTYHWSTLRSRPTFITHLYTCTRARSSSGLRIWKEQSDLLHKTKGKNDFRHFRVWSLCGVFKIRAVCVWFSTEEEHRVPFAWVQKVTESSISRTYVTRFITVSRDTNHTFVLNLQLKVPAWRGYNLGVRLEMISCNVFNILTVLHRL